MFGTVDGVPKAPLNPPNVGAAGALAPNNDDTGAAGAAAMMGAAGVAEGAGGGTMPRIWSDVIGCPFPAFKNAIRNSYIERFPSDFTFYKSGSDVLGRTSGQCFENLGSALMESNVSTPSPAVA